MNVDAVLNLLHLHTVVPCLENLKLILKRKIAKNVKLQNIRKLTVGGPIQESRTGRRQRPLKTPIMMISKYMRK